MDWGKILEYRDGKLFWLWRDDTNYTNTRYAGKEAGSLNERFRNVHKRVWHNGKHHYAHRIIWEMHYGEIPEGMQIDHIDGDGLNNDLRNLRLVTHKQNRRNCKRLASNTSGVTGVYDVGNGKWSAKIRVNDILNNLGTFTDKNEAIAARKAAEVKYGFHQNHGRS